MPEITHKDQPPVPAPPPMVAPTVQAKPTADPALEAEVKRVLAKLARQKEEAAKPKEPDWKNLSEREAMSLDVYIPVIEHDVPDYMNMKLKDTEYEVVWASKDQRRIGQLLAEGYEFLKKEDVDPNFAIPLVFDSDGHYYYSDVVCLKVHKRILYGKRRRALQVSLNQLSNRNRPPRVRVKDTFDLEVPVGPGVGSFYDPAA